MNIYQFFSSEYAVSYNHRHKFALEHCAGLGHKSVVLPDTLGLSRATTRVGHQTPHRIWSNAYLPLCLSNQRSFSFTNKTFLYFLLCIFQRMTSESFPAAVFTPLLFACPLELNWTDDMEDSSCECVFVLGTRGMGMKQSTDVRTDASNANFGRLFILGTVVVGSSRALKDATRN